MLATNMEFLRQRNRALWQLVRDYEEKIDDFPAQAIASKAGDALPTLQLNVGGRAQFLHSKYAPLEEAERIIEPYIGEMEQYEHIFFYGIGMGYHVKALMAQFPDKAYTLYEPNPYIFYHFVAQRDIRALAWSSIKQLFVETSAEAAQQFFAQFAQEVRDNMLFIPLPSYERIFQEQFQQFTHLFRTAISDKRTAFHVNLAFSERWIINSLLNFPAVLETTNIFDRKKSLQGKPVIIVSAGPSLADEYENLRYIKEQGLAYIFAVGSANKALIANNIYPDAVCTYDPQKHNHKVYARIIEQGNTSIPMIFGTSVGYETIEKYAGPKLHMITSQDTISQYYLQMEARQSVGFVDDAPSIALVTFQLLAKLDVGLIILVGQNFAFRDNQYYSTDVEYRSRTYQVKEEDLKDELRVEDVHGNQIVTNKGFNSMRLGLEQYIKAFAQQKVINTTHGGANIAGAPFIPLEEVINTYLNEVVVVEDWYQEEAHSELHVAENQVGSNHFGEEHTAHNALIENIKIVIPQAQKMERYIKEFRTHYKQMFQLFDEMQRFLSQRNFTKLDKVYGQFDRLVRKLNRNDFYLVYLQPIFRVQHELLAKKIESIRLESDHRRKVEQIIESFGGYFLSCRQFAEGIIPSIQVMHQRLLAQQANGENQIPSWKRYASDSGVFKFSGSWSRDSYTLPNGELPNLPYHSTQEKRAKVEFSFVGTSLRILASKRADRSSNIAITMDGVTDRFSQQDRLLDEDSAPVIQEVVYERNGLSYGRHDVVIQLLDEGLCTLDAVEINTEGRIYHPDEVTTISALEIGKRIRCHYTATYNKVGQFSGLGEETSSFIPPESSEQPDGDFYFIMVDEEDGQKKLIADRNIQHSISWDTLYEVGIARDEGVQLSLGSLAKEDNLRMQMRLLTGGIEESDKNNEWDRYIVNSSLNGVIIAGSETVWHWDAGAGSVVLSSRNEENIVVLRGKYIKSGAIFGDSVASVTRTGFYASHVGLRPLLLICSV